PHPPLLTPPPPTTPRPPYTTLFRSLEPSPLALGTTDPVAAWRAPISENAECTATTRPLTMAMAQIVAPCRTEVSSLHYRPRYRSRSYRRPESQGVSQIHAGAFDPDGDQKSRLDVGIRGGPMLDDKDRKSVA